MADSVPEQVREVLRRPDRWPQEARSFVGRFPLESAAGTDLPTHTHDEAYSPVGHDHDAQYAALGHDHDSDYAALVHTHDDRYYTETEVNALFAALPSIAILSASVNIPSTAAGGVGNMDVTVTGLAVGDFCFLVGRSGIDARGFGVWTRAVVTVTDTITIDYVNAQASTADPGSTTMYFLRVRVPA